MTRAAFLWAGLTVAQLQRLLGAVVSARLIHDEVPQGKATITMRRQFRARSSKCAQACSSERAASAAVGLLAVLRPGQACGSQFSSH